MTVTPAPADKETNIYLVNQPGATTETFLLTAEGKQTLNNSEENLEYIWYRTLNVEDKKVSSDTITGKENLMELPATKNHKWQVLLVVRDKSLDIRTLQQYNCEDQGTIHQLLAFRTRSCRGTENRLSFLGRSRKSRDHTGHPRCHGTSWLSEHDRHHLFGRRSPGCYPHGTSVHHFLTGQHHLYLPLRLQEDGGLP